MSDYALLIPNRLNWADFEPVFRNKAELERHLGAFRRYRNSVMHNREIDEVARMNGEAAILWLRRAIEARLGVEDGAEDPAAPNGSPSPAHDASPTPDDFHRLLTRRPIALGQKSLFKALYLAGADGLAWDDLITTMGRRDAYDVAGVLGALGRRVNGTPGFGATHTPGIDMVLDLEKKGEWIYRLTPAFRAYLEELRPEWLPASPEDGDE